MFGPWATTLVLSAILIIQALVFQDGGVLALGLNIINMAMLGVWAGYLPVRALRQTLWKWQGVFLGGVCPVLVSGILALAELRISGNPISLTLLAISLSLLSLNALEGAIIISVLKAVERLNPELCNFRSHSTPPVISQSIRSKAIGALAIFSFVLVPIEMVVASTLPDGIERLAQKLRVPFGADTILHSPLHDYQIQMLGPSWFSRVSAGIVGLLLVYLACVAGSYLLARNRRSYS